jgi:hypothetical protein
VIKRTTNPIAEPKVMRSRRLFGTEGHAEPRSCGAEGHAEPRSCRAEGHAEPLQFGEVEAGT